LFDGLIGVVVVLDGGGVLDEAVTTEV